VSTDSLGEFVSAGSVDVFILVNLIAVLTWYLWATTRTRTPWRRSATWCFVAGIVVLAVVYLGPLAAWSHTFFWVHMTSRCCVMMVAAPLLVLGAPTTLWFSASGDASRRRWVVPILRSRAVRLLTNPILTWLLFAGVLLGTHFSPFYEYALENHDADFFVEQPLYLVAAFLFYFPLIGRNLQPRRPAHAARMVSLATMMFPEAIVGGVIYFASAILYPTFAVERRFGPDPKSDQQLSGALMWALVMVVDSGWLMVAAAEWFASEERRGRHLDAQFAAEQKSAGASARVDDLRQ